MVTPQEIEDALQSVKDQPSFLNKLLTETLGWPMAGQIENLEDISYSWSAEELRAEGLEKKVVDGKVYQLQPLETHQIWGIFLLEFKNPDVFITGRGLAGPLRKVLRGLVPKHGSRHSALPSWNRENLLFICTYNYRHFRFGYFKTPKEKEKTASLALFGWNHGDTAVHTLCEYNLPSLVWSDDINQPQWQEAFNIEKVTKGFYRQVAILFTDLVGGTRKEGSKTYQGENLLKLPGGQTDTVRKEFAVRLIGRLIFCWFLKKKHSIVGIPLVPDEILSTDAIKTLSGVGGYYHIVLESLFFQVLNTPSDSRKKPFKTKPWSHIPFLNGGLFTPHKFDFYEPADTGYSKHINTLIVPDTWIQDLLDIFEQYNFTIDENTPVDIELSIEPEMLGRIFENLLAEINPETGETARKATGSYYTPRPIVEYMVDESLKQYLLIKTKVPEEIITSLLSYVKEEPRLTDSQKDALLDALHAIKIIDPACGSGAFPMGILQKILLILQKIDPDSRKWLERLLAVVPDSLVRKELKRKVKQPNYLHKLGIIRDCIYGVDIQPIAVEIAKLRCFLSLIVDEIVDDEEVNRGVVHLPNLEFKFVCANSLIGLPKAKIENGRIIGKTVKEYKGQNLMFEDTDSIEQLKTLREEYLSSFGREKLQIEQRFEKVQSRMFEHALHWKGQESRTLMLSQWKPFSHEPCPWFDSEWMFGIINGFDVAIGNPPYGLMNKRQNKGEGVPVTEEQLRYYKTAKEYMPALGGMLNIFRLFIIKSINLLTNEGVFLEIFPLAFIADKSMASLRKHVLHNFTIISIDAFPERDNQNKRVFEAAKMSVCIMKLVKINNFKSTFFVRINTDKFIDYHFDVCVLSNDTIKLLDSESSTIPLVSQDDLILLIKIYTQSRRFAEIGHCYTGEVDMTFGSRYFSNNPNNAILLKGAIIDRYVINEEMSQGKIVYLDSVKFISENSGEKLTHHTFSRIVMQGITGVNEKIRLKMTLAKNAFCANSVNYLILKEMIDIEIYFILALFNSKLMNYVFRKFSTNSNVNGYEIDNMPIPKKIPQPIQSEINNIVEEILTIKKKNPDTNTEQHEIQIDQIIYKLYGLTGREIGIIENQ
ncbi:MAG: Eco57I restriction-modification methylase domain-containing protein [Desulfobacterales bacterium]|nr:Eco57I restriction-modification methylase domain-containing protein [Desulfobacterales bacterium]